MHTPLFDNTQHSPVGYEPAIPTSEWLQAHTLHHVVFNGNYTNKQDNSHECLLVTYINITYFWLGKQEWFDIYI